MAWQPEIDYVAIAVAVVVYFIIGFLWYTPLFGKLWAKHMGMADMESPGGAAMARSMILNLVGNFLLVYVFFHVTEAFFDAGIERTIDQALLGGFWTWLGFMVPKELGAVAWEQRNWTVAGINAGYQLVSLLAIAAIFFYL